MANAWGTSQDPSKRLGGLMYGISPTDFSGQTDRLLQQGAYANRQAIASAGQATQGAIGTAQSNWANALKNTEGRGDAVMSDPYTQAALSRFQSVLGGQDVPYTDQVQNQLLARQADAGAAGGAAQASMLRDSMSALGGSMADPQAQAAMRQIQAQLQQQNNGNLGDMQSKATLANFGAKNDAASSLAATRASQLGMANSQYNQASQLYANQQLAGPHQNAVQGGPAVAYGGGQRPQAQQYDSNAGINAANADLDRDPRYASQGYVNQTPRPVQPARPTYLPNMVSGGFPKLPGSDIGGYNPNLPVY